MGKRCHITDFIAGAQPRFSGIFSQPVFALRFHPILTWEPERHYADRNECEGKPVAGKAITVSGVFACDARSHATRRLGGVFAR